MLKDDQSYEGHITRHNYGIGEDPGLEKRRRHVSIDVDMWIVRACVLGLAAVGIWLVIVLGG